MLFLNCKLIKFLNSARTLLNFFQIEISRRCIVFGFDFCIKKILSNSKSHYELVLDVESMSRSNKNFSFDLKKIHYVHSRSN